jgi:hypothetical protein
VRNPLSSEEAAFGLLVRVAVAFAVIVALVLIVRAIL